MDLYTANALSCSQITTRNYSTSFSLGIRIMEKKYRAPIYAIYGFVRFADEIVDTFHEHDKKKLLDDFRRQTHDAIDNGLSTNPVLHSFQWVVALYNIERDLIDAFLDSMEMDLQKTSYNKEEFQRYIYGSAEVVGLMCLKVFCNGDEETYQRLLLPARKLGEAFQKVNFLRDIQSDITERGRMYFPNTDFVAFDNTAKRHIEKEIHQDFELAYQGIRLLPRDVRLGVLLAYYYYLELLKKICQTDSSNLLEKRFRVSNTRKLALLFQVVFKDKFNMV